MEQTLEQIKKEVAKDCYDIVISFKSKSRKRNLVEDAIADEIKEKYGL